MTVDTILTMTQNLVEPKKSDRLPTDSTLQSGTIEGAKVSYIPCSPLAPNLDCSLHQSFRNSTIEMIQIYKPKQTWQWHRCIRSSPTFLPTAIGNGGRSVKRDHSDPTPGMPEARLPTTISVKDDRSQESIRPFKATKQSSVSQRSVNTSAKLDDVPLR